MRDGEIDLTGGGDVPPPTCRPEGRSGGEQGKPERQDDASWNHFLFAALFLVGEADFRAAFFFGRSTAFVVFGCVALPLFASPLRPALISAARAIICSNAAPVSPPFAGRFDSQMAGLSSARMSSKSPSLLTLRGANSAMSTSPDQSSMLDQQPAAIAACDAPG
jgi:hypothetical protein